ncbi:MAG: HlyD family efflux transporter periplasmic adaptor subunit, partial [Ignavibacteriae bacterium]|nr:HlyD family efflux transporter periplasmic adaptor subunit [Ignavibacteriota bacterium]
MKNILIIIIMHGLLLSCNQSHHNDDDHAHDSEGNHIESFVETPRLDFTIWTEESELFVEFPALIKNKTSRLVAHFTKLLGHKAIEDGTVTVSLINDNETMSVTVNSPSSSGIFIPELTPEKEGVYKLVFEIKSPELNDIIEIEKIQVFASQSDAIRIFGDDDSGENGSISFLKEQAWKMDFQTEYSKEQEIYETINTFGIWKVSPNNQINLVAKATGIVNYIKKNLTKGSKVKKGEVLFEIRSNGLSTRNLETEIENARITLNQIKTEYLRKKSLNEELIIPKSELEKVEKQYLVAQRNYQTLSNGYKGNAKTVIAPDDGFVKLIAIENGDFTNEGELLITLTNSKPDFLEIQVSPEYLSSLDNIYNIRYQTDKENWSNLLKNKGTIVSVDRNITSTKPMLSVYSKVNDIIKLPEGSYTEVVLEVG